MSKRIITCNGRKNIKRSCTANDLFFISDGRLQCGNCLFIKDEE